MDQQEEAENTLETKKGIFIDNYIFLLFQHYSL